MTEPKEYLDEEGFTQFSIDAFSKISETTEFQSFLISCQFGEISEEEFYRFVSQKFGAFSAYDLFKATSRKYIKATLTKLSDIITINKPERVLDVGCGTGLEAAFVAENLCGKVIGIDLSEEMLSVAKERIQKRKNKNLQLVVADREALPFSDSYFDLAVCYNSLVSIGDERGLNWPGAEALYNIKLLARLNEICRVVKDEGRFLLSLSLEDPRYMDDEKIYTTNRLHNVGFDTISIEHHFLHEDSSGLGSLIYLSEKKS